MSVQNKIAVVCICDGLNRRWIDAEATPCILSLSQTSLWCAQYRSVFPTVTRCSAASLTTGCYPDTHGLHGNTMALLEDGHLVVRDVGKPDFEDHLRRATGASLLQPSLPRLPAR